MITRRTFLGGASALALSDRLFAAEPESTKPSPDLEKLGAVALNEAKRLKATYCDIRITRYRNQTMAVRLNPERGTGKTLVVPTVAIPAASASECASSPTARGALLRRLS